MPKFYFIVTFAAENASFVVPSVWYSTDGSCSWPPYASMNKCHKAAKRGDIPTEYWNKYPASVVYETGKHNNCWPNMIAFLLFAFDLWNIVWFAKLFLWFHFLRWLGRSKPKASSAQKIRRDWIDWSRGSWSIEASQEVSVSNVSSLHVCAFQVGLGPTRISYYK